MILLGSSWLACPNGRHSAGAARGIGRACAVVLAEEGCNVVLADVNEAGIKQYVGQDLS